MSLRCRSKFVRGKRARTPLVALAAVLALFAPSGAGGGERRLLKIAMFADLSSVYSQSGGKGAIEAARMAIEDFGASAGAPVGFVFADPHNNAKNGAAIARKWYAEGVDVIADVPNSAVALAVQQVSREAKRIVLFSSPASDDLTGPSCSPYSVHWTYDTYAAAHGQLRRSSTRAATAGSSSRRTMPSATQWSETPAT